MYDILAGFLNLRCFFNMDGLIMCNLLLKLEHFIENKIKDVYC